MAKLSKKRKLPNKALYLIILIMLGGFNSWPAFGVQAGETRDIFFPTDTSATLTDSFGDGRTGHLHEGDDIMGEQMMPLYAAADGRVKDVEIPEASWGYAISLVDADGYIYNYLHVNNDTPGTDDDMGGPEQAYAPGIEKGAAVSRGQLIGWMGDSGNAEDVGPHLHFEIREPDGTAIDPYPSLLKALYADSYNPAIAGELSPDINTDKDLENTGNIASSCASGSLAKLAGQSAVYYCGADGRRYVFPNDKVYFTWYDGFDNVIVLTNEQMAAMALGGNVTYRPGSKLVKIQTDPKVYAVGRGGMLRWVQSAEIAAALYGDDWSEMVDDIPDSFFFSYRVASPISSVKPAG